MKRNVLLTLLSMLVCLSACVSKAKSPISKDTAGTQNVWKDYFVGNIIFEEKAPDSEGSRIYHAIIPDPKAYISEQARTVLNTLYFSLLQVHS